MSNCIFCSIITGDIPSAKVYEDEHVLAFLDISQVTKGHTLLIPKEHKENVYELAEEMASHLFKVAPKIANSLKATYEPVGLNLLNNNGQDAGQSVFHFHLHFIPRYGDGDGFGAVWKTHTSDFSKEDLQKMAKEINNNIQ
ncbi:protein hit [Bacillus coahuilensis p1.1.43]|uniref:Protein hit n=1 Tax=Bacillus coahuilensis p1.1.43 TaxID=1150625 RepID=A0A147KAZ8_9BACI|nr:HIT family protein [Bacillus coahuilensis]KUP07952.1 protein hit [Bacillus coahuilensis p1.1.43]